MITYVALLRGINVGGHKPIAMLDLREFAETLRFVEVRTLLQSGNLIFESETPGAVAVEKLLEKESKRRFGHEIEFMARSATEWKALIAGNPFAREAVEDPGHLLVMCLKEAPGANEVAALKAAVKKTEYFEVRGRHAYLVYPDGIGRSKLTSALIESKLGVRGTARNWNTVMKIAALLKA
jgi:uncharacterized protein (DUF1697 family)